MQLEVLLDVYLSWQLLLLHVFSLFVHLGHTLEPCIWGRVQVGAVHYVRQIFTTRHHIGNDGGQAWAGTGGCR